MLAQDVAREPARMSADGPRTTAEGSRRTPPGRRFRIAAGGSRVALLTAGAAGVLLLVASTFLTVIQIEVGTVSELEGIETAFSGFDRHGAALVLLGVVAALMLLGAARGARPAMAATAAVGAVALLIAVATDLPDAGETGQVGRLYSDARARPGPGFYAETLGGALLLVAGGGLLITSGRPRRAPRP
jgi:hypothetical protein